MRIRSKETRSQVRRSMPVLVGVCILTTTGCLSHADVVDRMARMSSGATGCAPDAISVTNEDEGSGFPVTWTANCNNAQYVCSAEAVGPAACSPVKPRAPMAAAHAMPAHTWQRYRVNECGISFLLPSKPTLVRRTLQMNVGPMVNVTAAVDVPGEVGALGVSCASIPGDTAIDTESALSGGRDKTLKSMGATFDSEERVETADFVGREIRFHVQGKAGRIRIYLRGRSLVSFVMVPTESFPESEVAAYFDSLAAATPQIASQR